MERGFVSSLPRFDYDLFISKFYGLLIQGLPVTAVYRAGAYPKRPDKKKGHKPTPQGTTLGKTLNDNLYKGADL